MPFPGAVVEWTEDQRRLWALWLELRAVWQQAGWKNIPVPDEKVYRSYRAWRRWADWLDTQERQEPAKSAAGGSGWVIKR